MFNQFSLLAGTFDTFAARFLYQPKDSIPCVYVKFWDFPSGYLPQFSAPAALGYSNYPEPRANLTYS